MIHFVSGDIRFTKAQVIVHGVSANDPMSHGLSLQLHELFPDMHRAYHHWCHQNHPEPGALWVWDAPHGKRIVHLVTQEGGYGHGQRPGKATLGHVRHALKALRKWAAKEHITSMALPAIATGVGGLQWVDVKPVMIEQLQDVDVPVFIYEDYLAKKPAQEPGL